MILPLLALCLLLQAPAPAAPSVTEFMLPAGVRAAVRHEPGSGMVAICAFVAAGAEADPDGSRVADLAARCLLGDNQNLSKAAVWRAVTGAGGDLTCTWSDQGVVLACETVPERFEDALYILAQALKHAEMDAESLAAAKRAIETGMRTEAALPDAAAAAACREALYPGSPYGKSRLQAGAALRRLTRADALRCFTTWFRPERCSVAVVGDVLPARARRSLENNFVDFERPPAPRQSPMPAETAREPGRSSLTLPATVSVVMAMLPAPSPASEDFPAALVLAALLGGGKGSRIFREVREAQGIGYALGAECRWLPAGNQIIASVEAPPADAARAEQALAGVLDGLATRPPTEAELERARRFAAGAYALSHERARERAFYLAFWAGADAGAAGDAGLAQRILRVAAADLLRVGRAALAHRAVAVAGPSTP